MVVVIDSGASHSFATESVVKSHYWLMDSIEQISIHLAAGSKVVSDLMCTIPIVLCDISGHVLTQYYSFRL